VATDDPDVRGDGRGERRVAANLPPKFGGPELAVSTRRIEHRPFTKGWRSLSGTKESFRSTRARLLYLPLDSIAIRARVAVDLHIHTHAHIHARACACVRRAHSRSSRSFPGRSFMEPLINSKLIFPSRKRFGLALAALVAAREAADEIKALRESRGSR